MNGQPTDVEGRYSSGCCQHACVAKFCVCAFDVLINDADDMALPVPAPSVMNRRREDGAGPSHMWCWCLAQVYSATHAKAPL